MYRILIVEDEPEAARNLAQLIRRYEKSHGEDFEIVTLFSAMDMLVDKSDYDACFLDIELPGISGMEAAQLIRTYNEELEIIFVTNLANFAAKGYEVRASGFIVKPPTYTSLSMNLSRALGRLRREGTGVSIGVPAEDDFYVVPFSSILFVEVRGHDLIYHLVDREPLKARGALGAVQKKLEGQPLLKISRSCLANMNHVSCIRGNDVVMVTGERIHIPRGRKRGLVEQLTDFLGRPR